MIASTLPLALLLLWALLEDVLVDGTHSVRAIAPGQRDEAEGWRVTEPWVEDLDWRLQRSDWVALPGRVAVARVPRRMQADALEILSSLDVLNIYFADTEHDPGLDGH